jgi:hypothetical protein
MRAFRSSQTWAVGFGSVVRFVAWTVFPPMSLPRAGQRVQLRHVTIADDTPTLPELTERGRSPAGCRACRYPSVLTHRPVVERQRHRRLDRSTPDRLACTRPLLPALSAEKNWTLQVAGDRMKGPTRS